MFPSNFAFFIILLCFWHFFDSISSKNDAQPLANSGPKRKLKILVHDPSFSFSHSQFLGAIADTLQEAGHEVHYFKMISDQNSRKNVTHLVKHIYKHEPRFNDPKKFAIEELDQIKNAFSGLRPTLNVLNHPINDMLPLFKSTCEEMIKNTEILDKLTNEHFDVAIGELYDYCPAAIFHRIGARTKLAAYAVPPVQLVASQFGIPTFASFIPNMIVPSTNSLESSFFARLLNFYNEFYDWLRIKQIFINAQEPIFREVFGQNFPSMMSISKNFSLLFSNSNPFFEFARPTSNKLIHIGGLVDQRNQKKQNLDGKFKQIMDNAKHGAVLFSFGGTIADTRQMNEKMLNAIINAFSAFPHIEFLWKLDKETMENNSALFAKAPNVNVFDWIPQSAILEHPNLVAFITHCGQNSVNEAARYGKPIIGIPLFGDQFYNSMLVRQKGMSIHLDVRELSGENAENVLISAIKNILFDPKYRQNAELIKKKLELIPFKARENLIRWVEFAAEFPELNELNLPFDDDMHWTVYYSLDAIGFTIFALFSILFLIWKFTKIIILYGLKERRIGKEKTQ